MGAGNCFWGESWEGRSKAGGRKGGMWSLLEKVHCGLDRGEDTGALTHHRIASSWGQDATLSYPLSISHWVWFPPTNFLGEGTLHLALGNFPSSGGIYEPSAANTQSSWGWAHLTDRGALSTTSAGRIDKLYWQM